jgi:hypothetical protein
VASFAATTLGAIARASTIEWIEGMLLLEKEGEWVYLQHIFDDAQQRRESAPRAK